MSDYLDYAAQHHDARHFGERLRASLAGSLIRIRFQLAGAILIGVGAPALIQGSLPLFADGSAISYNSAFGTVFATLLGYLFYRKMTVLPGASALMSVMPAFLTSFGLVAVGFWILRLDYSRFQLIGGCAAVVCWFMLVLAVQRRLRRPTFGFVPAGRAHQLADLPGANWQVLQTPAEASHNGHLPIVVDLDSPDLSSDWERYLAEAAITGRHVFSAQALRESLRGRVELDDLEPNSFGTLTPDVLYAPMKRYVDGLVALVALIALSPVLVVTALAIRLDSPGPSLFRQKRMGYQGRPFTVYKFRSMRVVSDAPAPTIGDPLLSDMTTSDDDRITRVGRFIRKTRIDELPQIFNILAGQMSWIGPRPETLALSAWYEREIPFYRYRHIVRPGISGWAQVCQGHVTSVEDVRQKLAYDLYYIRKFSVWLDLFIVLQTLRVMVSGKGAK